MSPRNAGIKLHGFEICLEVSYTAVHNHCVQ